MKVYVFKTSIEYQDADSIEKLMNARCPEARWNLDVADCDNILRIESNDDITDELRNGLIRSGFLCQELH